MEIGRTKLHFDKAEPQLIFSVLHSRFDGFIHVIEIIPVRCLLATMSGSKVVKCSICGDAIKTANGAMRLQNAPMVCRQCFGTQTYSSSTAYKVPLSGVEANAD